MALAAVGLAPTFRRAVCSSRTVVLSNQLAIRSVPFKVACRAIQTQSLPPSASREILDKQRLLRPSSPHFTIYQPQLTWLGSIFNRATGGALSFLLYGFALSYLTLPALGTSFDSGQIVELVHSFPEWVKYSGKALLAAPFAFHSWNGVRHLLWDSGKFLTVRGVYATGYVVLGLTAATTIGLVLL